MHATFACVTRSIKHTFQCLCASLVRTVKRVTRSDVVRRSNGNPEQLLETVPRCGSFITAVVTAARVGDLIVEAHESDRVVGAAQLRGHAALGGQHGHRTVAPPAGEAALVRPALRGHVGAAAASGLQGAIVTQQDAAGATRQNKHTHETERGGPQESLEEAGPERNTQQMFYRRFLFVHYSKSQ